MYNKIKCNKTAIQYHIVESTWSCLFGWLIVSSKTSFEILLCNTLESPGYGWYMFALIFFFFISLAIPDPRQPIRRISDCVRQSIFVTLISPVDQLSDDDGLSFHANIYRPYHFANNRNLLFRWNKNYVSIYDARFLWVR